MVTLIKTALMTALMVAAVKFIASKMPAPISTYAATYL